MKLFDIFGPYQLIAKGIALLLLIISLWAAWNAFTGHYIDQGIAKKTAIDKPIIDGLNEVNLKQSVTIDQQNDAIDNLKAQSDKNKAIGTQALADANKRAVGLQNQSKWLSEQLAKPDTGKTCKDALSEWRKQP